MIDRICYQARSFPLANTHMHTHRAGKKILGKNVFYQFLLLNTHHGWILKIQQIKLKLKVIEKSIRLSVCCPNRFVWYSFNWWLDLSHFILQCTFWQSYTIIVNTFFCNHEFSYCILYCIRSYINLYPLSQIIPKKSFFWSLSRHDINHCALSTS